MCDVETKGLTLTLRFQLHQFTQTDAVESDHSAEDSDGGQPPSDFKTMKRVEFLLQDTIIMVRFDSPPNKKKIGVPALPAKAPAKEEEETKTGRALKLADVHSDS